MKTFHKQFGCKAVEVSGSAIDSAMLTKINAFALKELAAEDVYVRKFLLAHDAIDRDNERFPSDLLDQFALTLPGKSMLTVHDRRSLPLGLFFDASTEEMTAQKFTELTGVAAQTIEGSASVKVLWSWSFMLNKEFNQQFMDNIDAGVYRHVSIGFAASDIKAVRKDINSSPLYYEYCAPGEALEGSLVWLGAQPGATAQKNMKEQDTINQEGEKNMKTLILLLTGLGIKSLVADASEDQVAAGIKTLIEEKDAKITALEGDAALGKAYKEKTVADYAALKQKMGEAGGDTPEALTSMKALASALPFDFLTAEVKSLQARVEAKFPTVGQLSGDENTDKSAAGDNPLIPKESK